MKKLKKNQPKEVEQPQQEEKFTPKERLEQEYDSFASAPTLGSPDNGLSIFIKLHQILEYLGLLINEIKALRQDVNSETPEPAKPQEENKEIY